MAVPGGTSYFSGGDNTRRHACGAGATAYGGTSAGRICGVQIEANYTGVRDNAANRDRFGDATAVVLEQYLATHWGLTLGSAPPPAKRGGRDLLAVPNVGIRSPRALRPPR